MNLQEGEALINLVRRGRADLSDNAADAFKRAAGLYPRARAPQRTAATRLLELQRPAEALIWAERAVALSVEEDDVMDALLLKAVALRDLGKIPEAITATEEAIERAPDARLRASADGLLETLRTQQ